MNRRWTFVDPLDWFAIPAGSDHYFHTCCRPSVRPYVCRHFSNSKYLINKRIKIIIKKNNYRYWRDCCSGRGDHWWHTCICIFFFFQAFNSFNSRGNLQYNKGLWNGSSYGGQRHQPWHRRQQTQQQQQLQKQQELNKCTQQPTIRSLREVDQQQGRSGRVNGNNNNWRKKTFRRLSRKESKQIKNNKKETTETTGSSQKNTSNEFKTSAESGNTDHDGEKDFTPEG